MSVKINQRNLSALAGKVASPRYERGRVAQSILHIGVGGFHRAHQAVYAEDLFHLSGDLKWGLCGIGLLPQDARMRDVMRTQDNLYTLVERGKDADKARVVGSIVNYLFAPEEREAVLEKMASAETKIVSLTITEGGYYQDAQKGGFDAAHPDITRDLAHPREPAGTFGYLLEALDRRRKRGLGPFTVQSCDNIQSNGAVTKSVLLAMAELRDPGLARWLGEHGVFPNSMVDRITPATTDEQRALVRDKFGIEDAWPVTTEWFRQWVVEDHFACGRPAWEQVGAQMTADVLPYEKMKLRLLNAGHQALCYIGMLLGFEFVHEAMGDSKIRSLVEKLMGEATPVVPPVAGVDLVEYKRSLIERFSNPAIRDQLSRIGMYGSSGMPKFVLPSVSDLLERALPVDALAFTVASWFRYLNGRDEQNRNMPMKDPQAARLQKLAEAAGADPRPFFEVREIFSESLAAAPAFSEKVRGILESFYQRGARTTLAEFVG